MQLPPTGAIRVIVERYAGLLARLADELGERPLVLPNSSFFPDEFRPDEKGVKRLVARMKRHAGLNDIPTKTRVVGAPDPSHGCGSGGCGSGGCGSTAGRADTHGGTGARARCEGCGPNGCGKESCACSHEHGQEDAHDAEEELRRLIDEGEAWRLQVPAAELKHPVVLTTNIARTLSYVFLLETLPEDARVEPPADVTADLAGVALGFGVLLMEGAHIYQKSCGGPSIGRVTRLSLGELAVATALFAALGRHAPRRALRELTTTQGAVFSEAVAWVESNDALVEALRRTPARVARGEFELSETQSFLSRALGFGKKKRKDELDAAVLGDGSMDDIESLLAAMPAQARREPKARDAKHDELKALVDEALEETGVAPRG